MGTGAADTETRSPRDPRPSRPPLRLLPAMATIVLVLIAMLAASVAGPPRISLPGSDRPAPVMPPPQQVTPTPSAPVQPETSGIGDAILTLVLLLLVISVVLVVAYFVVRALIRWIREWAARPRLQEAAPTDAEMQAATSGAPVPDAVIIRRGIAAARAGISAHAEPSDAIVAAWMGLEETAADSGSARGRSETPAEFTLRILLRRTGIDAPTRRLLRLYEGVRFAGRTASEQDRQDALSALTEVERGWR